MTSINHSRPGYRKPLSKRLPPIWGAGAAAAILLGYGTTLSPQKVDRHPHRFISTQIDIGGGSVIVHISIY